MAEQSRLLSSAVMMLMLLLVLMLHTHPGVQCARRFRGGRNPQPPPPPPPSASRRVATTTVAEEESFPLDFTAVEENMDNFMTQVKNLAQSLYPCSAQRLDHDMKLHLLDKNASVTCNDGTPSGYVLPERVSGQSSLAHILRRFIPYCSSDVWSGASPKTDTNSYAFMGSLIIQEVVKDLLTKGLDNAKVLLLAGSSAGGTGVLLNVDRVAELLAGLGHAAVHVRGLSDSGWFLDNKQYHCTDCVDAISCSPTETIRRGIKYWGSVVPEKCRQTHEGEEWNCFFGYRWLFDEAQLTVDNIHLTGQPIQEGQWRYIQNLGIELRNTLKDVPYWMDVQVKGTSLPRALHCWDRSLHDSHRNGNGGNGSNNSNKAPAKGCPVHLIDSCPWPHCNPTCPTVRDQFTGQEMNVIQFLMHMGFDVQKMAQQQGMDPAKLLGMLSSGS
ncbi:hypothetical protein CRUP_008259 [Coryphaenoides rupestris]|nr:hypothetical protein CRUP_008259 [Coryphaenoides rupestris]